MHLEFADPDFPGFITPSHETAKIGADNPDNLYRYARLNGAQRYRVSGQRGSVAYLSFGTQKGGYETDGKMIQTGFIDASQLQLDAQGNFEIRVNALACGWMWGAPVQAVVRQSAEARGISEAQVKAESSAGIPGGRMRTDDECARAALFLASDYSSAINGAQLDANGGEVMY